MYDRAAEYKRVNKVDRGQSIKINFPDEARWTCQWIGAGGACKQATDIGIHRGEGRQRPVRIPKSGTRASS